MNAFGLFGILSGSAVAIALFLSTFFLFVKRKENPHYIWAGLILLAISLRVGKSIFFFLMHDMAAFGLSLGFLGLSSIGPLSWFMVKGTAKVHLRNFWHFIIPVVGTLACYVLSPTPLDSLFYKSATFIMLIYVIASWRQLMKSKDQPNHQWNQRVLIMVSGVWSALVYQHIANSMMHYAIGGLIASIFIYWIFYQSFSTSLLTRGAQVALPDQLKEKVRVAFEESGLFRETGMSLQVFSAKLDIPQYLVTKSVKQLYGKSFPETLNHFRIEEIKKMLLDPSKEHFKIESLAYEVGFSSPSAFYASFKKCTGLTPTNYQKEALLSA